MQILRHAQFSITMEIYTNVSSVQTREALRLLRIYTKCLDGDTAAMRARVYGALGKPAPTVLESAAELDSQGDDDEPR